MITGVLKCFIPGVCGRIGPHCQQASIGHAFTYQRNGPTADFYGFRGPCFTGEGVFNYWNASPIELPNQGSNSAMNEGEIGGAELEHSWKTARLHESNIRHGANKVGAKNRLFYF